LGYPLRTNQLLNDIGFVPSNEVLRESWSTPGNLVELAATFAGWDETVTSIIAQIDTEGDLILKMIGRHVDA